MSARPTWSERPSAVSDAIRRAVRGPRRPLTIAAAAELVYAVLLAAAILRGYSAVDFAFVSSRAHPVSATIAHFAPRGLTKDGYDGQYELYIALDPEHAAASISLEPAYRYSHILFPMVARAVAQRGAELAGRTQIIFALIPEMPLKLQPTDEPVVRRIDGIRDKHMSCPQQTPPLPGPITLREELLSGLTHAA